MPEGPSIVILREQVARFTGQVILRAEGNAKIDKERLAGQSVAAFRSWGKHFLIQLPDHALRVHFLMFGSYTIDERKPREARLSLGFDDGELNLYSCAIREIAEPLDEVYDWSADVMSDTWNPRAALRKLRAMPDALVCDALLDQAVFAGVGNIIKNEVLFRIRVHPLSQVAWLSPGKLRELVAQARQYSFDFLDWKRQFVLRKHWLVHNKGVCARCGRKLTRAYLGETDRRTFFCTHCQKLYAKPAPTRSARSQQGCEQEEVNYVGTAGWSLYKAAAAFPGEGTALERYARVLRGVEINSSFYRSHACQTYARWAAMTPRDFRFAVKLPQAITHEARLRRARRPLATFLEQIGGLGQRLGPLLVQLPPSLPFEARAMRTFFGLLRSSFDGSVVCEPRHASWFTAQADAVLVAYQVGRVAADPAALPRAAEPGGWPGIVYYRLHGAPRRYWSVYDDVFLQAIAARLRGLARGTPAWCIFDNTAGGGALPNALRTVALAGGSRQGRRGPRRPA